VELALGEVVALEQLEELLDDPAQVIQLAHLRQCDISAPQRGLALALSSGRLR
jgi:hypothetical protein